MLSLVTLLQADLQLLGLHLPKQVVMRYILQNMQELALDPTPALLQWQAASGHLQPELERAPGVGRLPTGAAALLLPCLCPHVYVVCKQVGL